MNDRYSKLAFLHRVKERKILQFCTLFPEGGVVWKIPYREGAKNSGGKKSRPSTSCR